MNLLAGHRAPSWHHWLLDNQDRRLVRLDGVRDGSLEIAALSRLGASGDITIDDRDQNINWRSNRIQSIYDPGIEGVNPWPIATMRFASPSDQHHRFGTTYKTSLLSKLSIIDGATVNIGYALAAGTPVIDTVVELIRATGETRISATPSDAVLQNQLVFDEPDTSYLTVINKLLTDHGYWSLWCDGAGQFRVEPYVDPGDRPDAYVFAEGDASIHYPEWTREQDLAAVPNIFRIYREGDEETAGIEWVEELPDEHPFSVENTGFPIMRSEAAEVESLEAAQLLARRRLYESLSPVEKLTATHAVVPLDPHQAISFTDSGYSARCTVQKLRYTFDDHTHCSAEWRRI